jgi:hypothetical protein
MHGHMSRCTVTCHDARSRERKKNTLFIAFVNVPRVSGCTDNSRMALWSPIYVCILHGSVCDNKRFPYQQS